MNERRRYSDEADDTMVAMNLLFEQIREVNYQYGERDHPVRQVAVTALRRAITHLKDRLYLHVRGDELPSRLASAPDLWP